MVLASGSGGNAVVIEVDGACVLIDCGISYRQLATRMKSLGLEPGRIEIMLGSSSEDIRLRGGFEIVGPAKMKVARRVFICPVEIE